MSKFTYIHHRSLARRWALGLAASLVGALPASAAVLEGSYKLPASVDPLVATQLATELWAEVFRPDPGAPGPFPTLIFLHGNHGTCGRFDANLGIRIDDRIDYTTTGTCPAGYVPSPSHLGYNYLANSLADQGYVVVSINANRGVNAAPGVTGDTGLNLRRGRLVLRHMQQLSQWNAGVGTPPGTVGFSLQGLMDFSHLGLLGHSRGGEGMRAAIAQYKDANSVWPGLIGPVTFEGLFEIGPVDGMTNRILNPLDTPWNVLLPACDGDVEDLQGVRPLDRMLLITNEANAIQKSSFGVIGANHNFYNTEWQQSDAVGCLGQSPLFPQYLGSPAQRDTATHSVIPFFRAYIGVNKQPTEALRFDPSQPLPTALTAITTYARGFTPTPKATENFIVDNFNRTTGKSTANVNNQSSGLTTYSHTTASAMHDATQRAARVAWSTPGGYLQLNAANSGVPLNVTAYNALEFRVLLNCSGTLCNSNADPTGDVDFSIALAHSNGTLSGARTLKTYAVVRRPTGSTRQLNYVFQTVRIPLSDFPGGNLSTFRGVRFTFNQTASSAIRFGNVRLTKTAAGPGGLASQAQPLARSSAIVSDATEVSKPETNRIVGIRQGVARAMSGATQPMIEIEVESTRPFPVGGALPTLTIGGKTFTMSRFATGATDRLIFSLDVAEYGALASGADVSVKVGGARPWSMGRLAKP